MLPQKFSGGDFAMKTDHGRRLMTFVGSSRAFSVGLLLTCFFAPIVFAQPAPDPYSPAVAASAAAPAASIGDVIGTNKKGETAAAGNYTSFPVINASSAAPLVMLVMSRDEQLFIKAYSDYTDLDGDSIVDTTYNDNFNYSGYFASNFCYAYGSSQFKAADAATGASAANGQKNHKCDGNWSGNFLNWVTMSRLDVVRAVLAGGYRSTDTSTKTVLERADIPNDLHAWAKVYLGDDVNSFTPFSQDDSKLGISFCNATVSANSGPEMRVAQGNWSEWASTASRQCDWKETIKSADANNSYNDDASKDNDGLGAKEFAVRVEVCDPSSTAIRENFCQRYANGGTSSYKPVGLLQRYGENGQMRFGLLTGSFSAPRSGGVLRRNIGRLAGNGPSPVPTTCAVGDEIRLSDGTFCNQDSGSEGIINTLSRIKLTQWNFSDKWKDCNQWGILNRNGAGRASLLDPGDGTGNGDTKTACSAWGNPLSEMYAEALRYIAADGSPTSAFNKKDDLAGLPTPAWKDPYGAGASPYCAACSVIVLSTGLNSFDSDELPSWTKVGMDAAAVTKVIGADELINGENYLVGRVISSQSDLAVGNPVNTYEDLCSSKTVTDLSLARGICPDVPSMEGSYLMSGLAFQAWTKDMRPGLKAPDGDVRPAGYKNTVQTYAVALSENLPKFQIPVSSGAITLAPLCQANSAGTAKVSDGGWRSCYLGAVGVGTKTSSMDTRYIYGRPLLDNASAGSYSLVWEDSLWGNDHDNDVVTMLTYCVGDTCKRSTDLPAGTAAPAPKLCFYSDGQYNGSELCPTSASGPLNGQWKETLSSLRVPSGYTVTLYNKTNPENDKADSVSFTSDTADVGGTYNDWARSYSITGGPLPPTATSPTYAGYDICWKSDSAICTDNNGRPALGAGDVLVRVENLSAYAGNGMLTGYTVTGSSDDGVKRLALRPGNANASVLTSQVDAPASWYKPKVVKYTLGTNGAKQLENPLFYTAKYGGFAKTVDASGDLIDQPCDSTTTPACTTSNWDRVNNDTGVANANGKGDGLPDNFFPVRNPAQLGERLASVFNAILTRSGSGTSAAVVSSSAAGDGLTYQALYQAKTQNTIGSQSATWTGALNALWTDADGRLRAGGYAPGGLPTLGSFTQSPIVVFCTTTSGDSRFFTYTDPNAAPAGAIAPASCTGQSLDKLKTVWSAQSLLSAASYSSSQRAYGSVANAANGRYIFTWVDANHDGVVDSGEQRDFDWSTSGFGGSGTCDTSSTVTGDFRFLDTCSAAGAQALIGWVRGTDYTGADGLPDPGWRSRTVDDKVYRLGDVIDSTPLAVGTPAEAFDLLYNDSSYGTFRKVYQNRRQMIYVGANDGMLHAFNGGFYNAALKQLDLQPRVCTATTCSLDTSVTAHPLGSEIWSYVPGNLLPHLRWLADPAYIHMFYVDGSPISQDVRVFADGSSVCSSTGTSQCHPDGWGTILIVPFRFGGGPITLDTKEGTSVTQQSSFPAYVVLDVTNPEAAPVVLAELTNTDGTACSNTVASCSDLSKVVSTYTSSLPAVAMFRPAGTTVSDPSKFFLFTGSGTTDNGGVGNVEGGEAASTTGLSIRAYDLSNIASNDSTPLTWGNNKGFEDLTDTGATGAGADSFAGDLIASDYDLNGVAESLYFGSTKKGSASPFGGALWAIDLKGVTDSTAWLPRLVLSGLNKPVTVRPTLGLNNNQQHMVFFGTGRVYTKNDLSDKSQQAVVGLIDSGLTTAYGSLLDVTDVTVTDKGVVAGADTSVTDINALTGAAQLATGWISELDIPKGTGDTSLPSERVVATQVLSGGALLTTSYIPGTDLCTDQGTGRLYAMNYGTGTADARFIGMLGTTGTDTKTINKSISLGKGLPSQPSLHNGGTGSTGDQTLRACVQTSSGAIICHDILPLKGINSSEISWREPLTK
ncbi:MAG: PilC/PilY family type IV pilus protein [Pseudomonadota bacterium]|nr:PilC/PilY family type IV pilus protein [Pseudomonadota bacterium]